MRSFKATTWEIIPMSLFSSRSPASVSSADSRAPSSRVPNPSSRNRESTLTFCEAILERPRARARLTRNDSPPDMYQLHSNREDAPSLVSKYTDYSSSANAHWHGVPSFQR